MEVIITANNESHTFNISEKDFELLVRIASTFKKKPEKEERQEECLPLNMILSLYNLKRIMAIWTNIYNFCATL